MVCFIFTKKYLEIHHSSSSKLNSPSIVTIGTFDGVHIGHQKIIEQLVSIGKSEGLNSCVLTFFPHPRMVLQKDANIKLINTIDERKMLLEKAGVDVLFIKKFDKDFSRLNAEDFTKELLVETLQAKKVIIGYDHRFGRNRSADITDLKSFGKLYDFEVEEIPVQDIKNVAVSSTKIRKALNDGDIETANNYLGYSYLLTGKVIKGKQLGKTIDFPTANLSISESYKLIPKHGSYIVYSNIKNKKVFGMMNIGVNPTVNGEEESIEVHFFDFKKTLYNEVLQVNILHRLRDEKQFNSLADLKSQLEIDKNISIQYIAKHHAQ